MKRFILLGLVLAAATSASAASGDVDKGQQIASTLCAACHAADGNSGIALYPRLAGQDADYIAQQVHHIKDGTRTTGAVATMRPFTLNLSDEDIQNVAAYFAAQQPTSGEADPKNLELGAKIFRGGLADKHVPACMACHGPSGAGLPGGSTAKDGVIAYPRLAGQHKSYIKEQLNAYASGDRKGPIMPEIAARLSAEEIDAVANFIQGLH